MMVWIVLCSWENCALQINGTTFKIPAYSPCIICWWDNPPKAQAKTMDTDLGQRIYMSRYFFSSNEKHLEKCDKAIITLSHKEPIFLKHFKGRVIKICKYQILSLIVTSNILFPPPSLIAILLSLYHSVCTKTHFTKARGSFFFSNYMLHNIATSI